MKPSSPCILVVDDHEDNRLLLTLLLQRAGYRVVAAGSYAQGWSCAQQTPFDLYLLDNRLGDGTGAELRHKLRELHPTTPALHCTGISYSPGEIETLRQRGDDYRLKPADPADLMAAIERLLRVSP